MSVIDPFRTLRIRWNGLLLVLGKLTVKNVRTSELVVRHSLSLIALMAVIPCKDTEQFSDKHGTSPFSDSHFWLTAHP
jgi:hypothetical protein